jgi:hypothetical protein
MKTYSSISKTKLKRIIKQFLKKYEPKEIKIRNKKYTLYVVPELSDEDLNVFDGIIVVDNNNKREIRYIKTYYKPPVSGYSPRIAIIFSDEDLIIKDYRRNKYVIKNLNEIDNEFINELKDILIHPSEEKIKNFICKNGCY